MLRRALLVSLIVTSSFVCGEDWHGSERVRGRVRAADGTPAQGARIRLSLRPGTAGPPEVATDADGRFRLAGLAPGAWSITIDFPGHIVTHGRVPVRAGSSEPIEVRLRSLEEVPPLETETPVHASWPERPVVDAEPHRKGRFRMLDPARPDETFEVYVPESYAPGKPHGLLVWISPTAFGGTERPEIRSLLDERAVIWIGANRSGNDRAPADRAALALDAATAMRDRYDLDRERVWIGGYSGGGRAASRLALVSPDVFRGGLFVMGCDFYRDLPVPSEPGSMWPAAFPPPPKLRELQREHRFVLLTGSRDFNVSQCRTVAEAFVREGFRHTVLLEVPGMSHYDPVPEAWWGRALSFLDGRPSMP